MEDFLHFFEAISFPSNLVSSDVVAPPSQELLLECFLTARVTGKSEFWVAASASLSGKPPTRQHAASRPAAEAAVVELEFITRPGAAW